LPRVSDATLEVFLRDIQRQGSEGGQTLLLSGLAQKIPRENPVFWREINQYREDSKNYSPNPKDHGLGVLAGAIIGLAILVRPIAILSPIIILPMAMRNCWRNGIYFLAGLILILAPWVISNYQQGYGVTVSYIGAFNLAHGNAAKFYQWQNNVDAPTALETIEKEVNTTMRDDPSLNIAQAHKKVALQHILSNIPAYTWFHLVKTSPFFLASSIKGIALNLHLTNSGERTADLLLKGKSAGIIHKLIKEFPFTMESILRMALTILMFVGAWNAWKKRNAFLVLLFFLIILFALLMSPWAEVRFRVPLEPYMLLLAFSVFIKNTSVSKVSISETFKANV